MAIAFFFLSLLIGATPIAFIFEGPITHGLVTATVAVALSIVALRIRPGEAGYLESVVRPLIFIAAIPALWMLIQAAPLGSIGLAHPIWTSAATALGRPIAGSISIDTGATLIASGRYLSTVAIALLATAVALDRQRAERILFALTGATTLVAILSIYTHARGFAFYKALNPALMKDVATVSAALGIIFACTTAVRAFERYETQRARQGTSTSRAVLIFLTCLIAISICSLAVVWSGTGQAIFAIGCGVATLVAVIVIRRFGFGPWGYSAVAATILVVAGSVVALLPGGVAEDLTLRFAAQAPAPQLSITQRILTDARWAGTGAGTFAALVPIYRDIDELMIEPAAPTAAAAIAVELGRPGLWAITIAAVYLIMMLLRRALRRGRDSFYPAAGASCLVTLTVLAFCNAGLFSTTVSIFAAAIFGMALAQSQSRAIQ